ncbi:MAG: four helix bundle protein [Candidatus Berkelbacteria bacterium]
MSESSKINQNFDLESRTLKFAKDVRELVKLIPKTLSNFEDSKQVVRSSGSVAANYIEANESLGKKDFLMRVKICRKEAKESILWLTLLQTNEKSEPLRNRLLQESSELMKIFGSIITKCSQ